MALPVTAQIGSGGRIVRLEALRAVGRVLAGRTARSVGGAGVARIISVVGVARISIGRVALAVVGTVTAVTGPGLRDCDRAAHKAAGRNAQARAIIATAI